MSTTTVVHNHKKVLQYYFLFFQVVLHEFLQQNEDEHARNEGVDKNEVAEGAVDKANKVGNGKRNKGTTKKSEQFDAKKRPVKEDEVNIPNGMASPTASGSPPVASSTPHENRTAEGAANSSSTTTTSSYHSQADPERRQRQNNVLISSIRHGFKSYGEWVASQSWEVLVGTIILLIIIIGYFSHLSSSHSPTSSFQRGDLPDDSCSAREAGKRLSSSSPGVVAGPGQWCEYSWNTILVVVLMSLLALLHQICRFIKIFQMESRIINVVSFIYLVITFGLYLVVVGCVGGPHVTIGFHLFLIPLFNNPHWVARMTQMALCSSHSGRIRENVASAMYLHAPTFFLDSIDKIMFFGLGIYAPDGPFCCWMQVYGWYGVVSALVIFVVYFTLFPAGLSMALNTWAVDGKKPTWNVNQILNKLKNCEDCLSPNVHRFKVLVSAFLFICHMFVAPWPIFNVERPWSNLSEIQRVSALVWFLYKNLDRTLLVAGAISFSVYYLCTEDVDEGTQIRRTYLEGLRLSYGVDTENSNSADQPDTNSNSSVDEGVHSMGDASNEALASSSRNSNSDDWSEDVPRTANVQSEAAAVSELSSQGIQTNLTMQMMEDSEEDECQEAEDTTSEDEDLPRDTKEVRSVDDCKEIIRVSGLKALKDKEIIMMLEKKFVRVHDLEARLDKNFRRAVRLRRKFVEGQAKCDLSGLPSAGYEYHNVFSACCESVVGYVTLPVGWVGPLNLDGKWRHFPMATTEGCLVASVNRGCAVLRESGVTSVITADGMTRGPIVQFHDIKSMAAAKLWMEHPDNFEQIKKRFDGESRFARLKELKIRPSGRSLYIRFVACTGDAMGMNMLSKGTQAAITWISNQFPEMEVISLSGNFCTDKKPAAVNWIDGRGKSVTCEALVSSELVRRVLKTTPEKLAKLNLHKNLIGSAMAGSIGGFNAQAANVVSAIFIATGQDPAQNVCSSNCLTNVEVVLETGDLRITCEMPSIEVGTVGGGTILGAQGTCLDMMGVRGPHPTSPGDNATQLARIVCAAVLAGELSLMSALTTGDLVRSHMRHNRSTLAMGTVRHQGMAVPLGSRPGGAIKPIASTCPLSL